MHEEYQSRSVVMEMICKLCKNRITDLNIIRCPRCHSILREQPKCEDCKKCSLKFGKCNEKIKK